MSASPFPAVDEARWRARVGEQLDALRTVTVDGPVVEPLSAPAASAPAWARAGGWQIAQVYSLRTIDVTARALASAKDLELAWIGALPQMVDDDVEPLARVLGLLDLRRQSLVLRTGLPQGAAGVLRQAAAAARVDLAALRGGLFADPLGELVRTGGLSVTVDDALGEVALASGWLSAQAPALRTVLACGLPWHSAGASAVDELAAILGTALATMRAFETAGVGASAALCALAVRVGIGGDVLVEIAKIRALRWLLLGLGQRLGAPDGGAGVPIHAATTRRVRSRIDVDTNLVRATLEAFAAAVGGADTIALGNHDPRGTAASARWARNISHLLRHEAHVDRVADPTAGSGTIEALTESIARATWTRVQAVEAQGGLVAALRTGEPQARVAATAQARFDAVATGRTPLVGISKFAPQADRTRATTAPEPVTFDPSTWVERVDPIVPQSLAEPYERTGVA